MGRQYTLTVRLEEGALAELFRARAEGPGAPEVVVKLFNPKMSDPAYAKALADVGARTLALGHPQALAYEEVGMAGGRIAAVRPHFEGFNLGDALRRLMSKEIVLPPAVALYLVAEAAQVVAQAHAQGWAHGAITPGNILLGFDGKVRITDFGALEAMGASPALKAFAAKGRHAYRAPEQRDPAVGKPAGDVYSLGAIAYELLTLREVAQSRGGGLSTKRDSLPSPSRVDRRLNARMDPVVMRALDLAATRRYHTAADYSEALRGLFSVLGYAPGIAEVVRFVKELFPNEVTIGGIGGELPIEGPFTLDQVFSDLPTGTASALDPSAEFAERAPFTSTELEAVGQEPTPLPPRAPETPAEPASDFESWEAPPGQMPQVQHLARRSGHPAEPRRETVEAPEREPEARRTHRRSPSLETEAVPARTPVETPAALGDGREDSGLSSPRQVSTSLDWHIPPAPPPRKPPKPRVGFGVWAIGLVGCAVASAAVYLAVSKRLGTDPMSPPSIELGSPQAGTQPEPAPSPDPQPAPGQPAAPAPAKLSIDSSVPAAVFIDGRDTGETLPLAGFEVPAGKHTVMLVHGQTMREFTVVLEPGQEEKRADPFGSKQRKRTTSKTRTRPR